jgi:hypothetical protein
MKKKPGLTGLFGEAFNLKKAEGLPQGLFLLIQSAWKASLAILYFLQ